MLPGVATTEATDPTRVSGPFRTTARRHEVLDEEVSRRNPFGCLEVSAEKIVHDVTQGIQARQTMEPRVRITKRRRQRVMAAKKKAAKKPAAKKNAAKKKKEQLLLS